MKFLLLPGAVLLLMAGCTTKVYNQPGPTGQPPTVIEHDREIDHPQPQPARPEVQNNVHVDRD